MQPAAPPPEDRRDGPGARTSTATSRDALLADAVRMATEVGYGSLGTFEFLVDADTGRHVFIEANPRLQVEHTVTEEVLGIDLVRAQLELAAGRSLAERRARPGGRAGAARHRRAVPGEHGDDGRRRHGPSRRRRADRVRGAVRHRLPHRLRSATSATARAPASTRCSPRSSCTRRRRRCPTRSPRPAGRSPSCASRASRRTPTFLQAILAHPDVRAGEATTRFVDDHVAELVAAAADQSSPATFAPTAPAATARRGWPASRSTPSTRSPCSTSASPARPRPAPAAPAAVADELDGPAGTTAVRSPLQGTIVAHRRRRRRPGRRRPAAARHGGDEDGARRHRHRGRASCASSAWPSATPSSRATRSCSSSRPTSATS